MSNRTFTVSQYAQVLLLLVLCLAAMTSAASNSKIARRATKVDLPTNVIQSAVDAADATDPGEDQADEAELIQMASGAFHKSARVQRTAAAKRVAKKAKLPADVIQSAVDAAEATDEGEDQAELIQIKSKVVARRAKVAAKKVAAKKAVAKKAKLPADVIQSAVDAAEATDEGEDQAELLQVKSKVSRRRHHNLSSRRARHQTRNTRALNKSKLGVRVLGTSNQANLLEVKSRATVQTKVKVARRAKVSARRTKVAAKRVAKKATTKKAKLPADVIQSAVDAAEATDEGEDQAELIQIKSKVVARRAKVAAKKAVAKKATTKKAKLPADVIQSAVDAAEATDEGEDESELMEQLMELASRIRSRAKTGSKLAAKLTARLQAKAKSQTKAKVQTKARTVARARIGNKARKL